MIKLGDIIHSVAYDALFRSYGRKTPILVVNNEFYNVDDPKLIDAKRVAISDMKDNTEYIPPELIDSE